MTKFEQLLVRLASPTPKFFVAIRNGAIAVATIGGAIAAAPIPMPPGVQLAGQIMAWAGGAVAATCQLTTPADGVYTPLVK